MLWVASFPKQTFKEKQLSTQQTNQKTRQAGQEVEEEPETPKRLAQQNPQHWWQQSSRASALSIMQQMAGTASSGRL